MTISVLWFVPVFVLFFIAAVNLYQMYKDLSK